MSENSPSLGWDLIMMNTVPYCVQKKIKCKAVHVEGRRMDEWLVFEDRPSHWFKNPIFISNVWLN